jgi:multidrug efflux pump subunit AcrA (membrane-fusion protein)
LRFIDVAMLSSLVFCAACSGSGNADTKPSATPAPHVDTTKAASGVLHATLSIAGVVEPYRQVGIAADLTEPIADVDVQEGDHVRAGQVLAHLQTDDLQAQLVSAQRVVVEDAARYAQSAYSTNAVNQQDLSAVSSAQATLHQARVSLDGATTDLKRYESLETQGYLAPQTVDQQRTTVASDTAAVNAAQASLNQAIENARANGTGTNAGEQQSELQEARAAADAEQASVEQLRRQIARAVIVSPVDGIVDAVNANPGEYPTERQLFTIEQLSSVFALLPSSTAQVVQVRSGASVAISLAGVPQTMTGKVAAVLDALQPGTTNFTVKVLVPNPNGILRSGMPVTGVVALPPVSGIEIPMTAFVDDTHTSVYAIENNVARSHAVHDVKDDGTHAIVTGLTAGTEIVSDVDSSNVGNGDRVSTGATPAPDATSGAHKHP